MTKHTPSLCTGCDNPRCTTCVGGLVHCSVCHGAEGSLPTDCPGAPMNTETADNVYSGHMDYTDEKGWHPVVTLPKPAKVPCGSCPYRKDVPSGIWAQEEYDKLPGYDGSTMEQIAAGAIGLFYCHQQDGCLCGGWVKAHDLNHLAALRFNTVDASVAYYDPDVEVFESGAAARAHGMKDIEAPNEEAQRKINGLLRQREDWSYA